MTKKNFLFFSLIGLIVFIISFFSTQIGICKISSSCIFIFDPIAETLIIFVPFFLLSLIIYKMRDEIFKSWLKFTYIWIPLTIILTLLAPEYSQSLLPIFTKGFISFFFSIVFLVVLTQITIEVLPLLLSR